jgi:anti-sigma B factor antagonist
MRQIAHVVAELHDTIPVARIEGEIDLTNAGPLGDRLRALLTNRSDALVVDLSPTTYLDSSGVTLLFGLVEELRRRQQELHLVVPDGSPLLRVIAIVGLGQAAPVHGSVEAALERVRSA